MRKRIFRNLVAIMIVAMILLASITVFGSFLLVEKALISNIRNQGKIIASGIERYGVGEYLNHVDYDREQLRITIIESDGRVSFDSQIDINELRNHGDRLEVVEAQVAGSGFAKRYSTTLKTQTYYYSIKLASNQVLRISTDVKSVYGVIDHLVPRLLLVSCLLALCFWIIADRLTKHLLKPMNQMAEDFPHGLSDTEIEYEELIPFVKLLQAQQRAIQEQMEKLEQERDTMNLISQNMQEGLIIVDHKKRVLAMNLSAQSILGVKSGVAGYIGEPLLSLTRNQEVNQCVTQALQGQSVDLIMTKEEQYFRVFGCGVMQKNKVVGAMLFIFDVTASEMAQTMRREFTANVSHELRTPLTSISGYAELMAEGMVNPEDYQEFAAKIFAETQKMIAMIKDLIILSKLDEGKIDSQEEMMDLVEVAQSVTERLRSKAEERNVNIKIQGQSLEFYGARNMIEEILFNVLDNGIKYNRDGGSVTVCIVKEQGRAKVQVKDTGIGIPKHMQSRIFERFFQADPSRSKGIGGTGLGLSIVKHMVNTLGGKVWVESTENVGTTLSILLPLNTAR